MGIERRLFEAVVQRHHAAVYRTARAIVRSDADAADVTQQVFLHCWRGKCSLAGDPADVERSLRWLASRLSLNTLRAGTRRRRHEQESTAVTAHSRDLATPSAVGLGTEELAAVRASIDELDDDHRTAVVLRFCEGMTLAAIGTAVGCAESTVHARLEAAFARLRRRLKDLGFAAVAGRVEVGVVAAAAAVEVPAALAGRLLAIPAAASSFALGKLAAAAALLLGVGSASWWWNDESSAAAPTPVVAIGVVAAHGEDAALPIRLVVAQDPVPSNRTAVGGALSRSSGGAEPRYASAPTARVIGTIADDAGTPSPGAVVAGYCRALSSKGSPFVVEARTDAQGFYDLTLPIPDREGLDWRLSVRRPDWAGTFAPPDVHLMPGELRRGVDAVLRRWAGDEPGEWSTQAFVADAAGRPVLGATVHVERRMLDSEGREKLVRECGGKVDENGRVELRGDHLGEKLVRVDAFGKPFAPQKQLRAVAEPEPATMYFTLAADVPLEVRTVDARTGAPVRGVVVHAERDDVTLAAGGSDEDGRMLLNGLDGEPVVLVGGGGAWSHFELPDVRAGGGVVELRLKRLDDPEAIGLHRSELHGRVIDAATGEPLAVEAGDVKTWWVPVESPVGAEWVIAQAVTPRPYQTVGWGTPPPPSADFHLEVTAGQRFAVYLSTEGRAVAVAGPFDLAKGELRSGIELRAEVGVRVEVDVRDASGSPVEGAEVWLAAGGVEADADRADRASELLAVARRGGRAVGGRGTRTDASGRAVFVHVPTRAPLCVHAADATGRHGGGATAAFEGEVARREVVVR